MSSSCGVLARRVVVGSVVPALEAAGHATQALTLPGLESLDVDRSGITLRDHVGAVVAPNDAADQPVVLVGHSAGGSIIAGAADARPERVARAVTPIASPRSVLRA